MTHFSRVSRSPRVADFFVKFNFTFLRVFTRERIVDFLKSVPLKRSESRELSGPVLKKWPRVQALKLLFSDLQDLENGPTDKPFQGLGIIPGFPGTGGAYLLAIFVILKVENPLRSWIQVESTSVIFAFWSKIWSIFDRGTEAGGLWPSGEDVFSNFDFLNRFLKKIPFRAFLRSIFALFHFYEKGTILLLRKASKGGTCFEKFEINFEFFEQKLIFDQFLISERGIL